MQYIEKIMTYEQIRQNVYFIHHPTSYSTNDFFFLALKRTVDKAVVIVSMDNLSAFFKLKKSETGRKQNISRTTVL